MTVIEGTIERITFRSDSTGYTVARFRETGGDLQTAVGVLPDTAAGDSLKLTGEWTEHPEYGRQFKFESFERLVPATLAGIERYLGSGLIKGIGPQTARRIVHAFGMDALLIIQDYPERLHEVEGIGEKKAEAIHVAVAEQREVQDIMVFLQGYGVSPAYAARIYKTYGRQSIAVVRSNPYRLAGDVFGIGFKIADRIARSIGIPAEAPERIMAGAEFILGEMDGEGHVFTHEEDFVRTASEMLEVSPDQVEAVLPALEEKRVIFRADDSGRSAIYQARFYYAECGVADRLRQLSRPLALTMVADIQSLLDKIQKAHRVRLAEAQLAAVQTVLAHGVTVITGGPGTGKTTTLRTLLAVLQAAGQRVVLAAPTGRAAKRMTEATGHEARTLHRLLEFGAESGAPRFGRNEDRPLDAEAIIVDEVSMVDLLLMNSLLRAIPHGSRLVLVGDADQLPSVGAGNVLRDIISSGVVPVVRLNVIFRQDAQSLITVNAHRINEGKFPVFSATAKDFFFVEESDPEKVAATVVDLVSRRLPGYLHCHPIEDIQVLTPMRRTVTGVDHLNPLLQQALNGRSEGPAVSLGALTFRAGDKVMQIRNNYQKLVFNGDIGRICRIDPEEREIRVSFPEPSGDRTVGYDFAELDELVLSYAVSVHKSQGSEYPVVVMPVTTQHYVMLQRNLLYTAITRARRMVVLIGTRKAIMLAVKNNRMEERRSMLSPRLCGYSGQKSCSPLKTES